MRKHKTTDTAHLTNAAAFAGCTAGSAGKLTASALVAVGATWDGSVWVFPDGSRGYFVQETKGRRARFQVQQ